MALDALKGEAALDALADLIDPVFSIAQDEALAGLLSAEGLGDDPREGMAERLRKAAPKLIKGHKDDLVRIMAATQGKDEDEVRDGLTLLTLPLWLVSLFKDPVVLGFLASLGEAADAVRDVPSGSPSESTAAPEARGRS